MMKYSPLPLLYLGVASQNSMDVPTCDRQMQFQCKNTNDYNYGMMLDTCNGHASPYHYHSDLVCDYERDASATKNFHSPLVGYALDGRGIYGVYEKNSQGPADLDLCGGHFGPVPGYSESVYHYHTQGERGEKRQESRHRE